MRFVLGLFYKIRDALQGFSLGAAARPREVGPAVTPD
jgi:hypothetical protein